MKNSLFKRCCVLVATMFCVSCGADAGTDNDAPLREAPAHEFADTTGERDDIEMSETPEEADESDEPEPEEPTEIPCLVAEGCVDAFPTRVVGTTVGGSRTWDRYTCELETNESGPERVFRVVLPHAGFFAVEVVNEAIEADIDVHLLLENSSESCMDRGHLTAGAYLEAGIYWVAADTWVDDEGHEYAGMFELAFNLTRPEDLSAHGMKLETATDALTAFATAWQRSETRRFEYTITDFSMHSRFERQWIVQLATGELLYHLHVGHGEGSIEGDDLGFASVFSNVPESHQSSIGMVLAAETYTGDFGYSLALDGLEAGFNHNIRDREIVVHPWDGNLADVIQRRLGCAELGMRDDYSGGV